MKEHNKFVLPKINEYATKTSLDMRGKLFI